MMRTILPFITGLMLMSTTQTLAYPINPGQNPSDFQREQNKVPYTLYQGQQNEFTFYRKGQARRSFLDSYKKAEQKPPLRVYAPKDQEAFKFYNKIEEKYQKNPRFRY